MRVKVIAGISAGIIIGAIFGIGIGLGPGMERGISYAVNMSINKDAKDVQSQIAALKYLRAGEIDQGIEIIEANMDDQLVLFDPAEPYSNISLSTFMEVAKALKQCKKYRAEHPRKSNRPHVDEMVKNVIKRGVLN